MKLPKGVDICLLWTDDSDEENRVIFIEQEKQMLGSLSVGKATIDVKIDSSVSGRIFGIAIDHKHGKVSLRRNLARDPVRGLMIEDGGKFYQTKVAIMDSKDCIPTTKYPQNYMTLVELDEKKMGLVRIWEVALVSQNGLFWVTRQCTYEVQCYNNHGRFSCPFFEMVKPRPSLVELLFNLFADELMSKFPRVTEYVPPKDPPKPWPNQGRVLWWNSAMQYGVILTTEGVARLHWSNVEKFADGFIHFNPYDIVTYKELGSPFQTNEHGTNIKFEAYGVIQIVSPELIIPALLGPPPY